MQLAKNTPKLPEIVPQNYYRTKEYTGALKTFPNGYEGMYAAETSVCIIPAVIFLGGGVI